MSNVLEVFDRADGGKEVHVTLCEEEHGLTDAEQQLIKSAIDLIIDGCTEFGVNLYASDSRAMVVRSSIAQWIQVTKHIQKTCT